jgi:glycosyltransferase involved in cell wall biosynthesis
MQILMVSNYFDSHPGGIEAVAGQLYHRLAGPECHITWAAAGVSAIPPASPHRTTLPLRVWNGIECMVGLPFPIPSPAAFASLWSSTRSSDVVILHDCLYLSNIAAFAFARLQRTPVLIVQHIGSVPFANRLVAGVMNLANRLITRPMLRAATQVAFISQTTQRHFSEVRFSRPPVLVFNGTDTGTFRPPADGAAKARLRAPLGLPDDKPVALFVGRFVEKKGLPILRKMAGLNPDIVWAFAGSGPLSPRDWSLANVRVYSDLRGSSLADLYRAADIFVLPSIGEGFPLVIQEALACGLPIVCGAETATADDALAGFVRGVPLVPSHEQAAQDFLAAIREILNGPVSAELTEQRFAFVESRYAWTGILDRYLRIIEESTLGPGAVAPDRDETSCPFAPSSDDGDCREETSVCALQSESSPRELSDSR